MDVLPLLVTDKLIHGHVVDKDSTFNAHFTFVYGFNIGIGRMSL